MTRKSKQYSFDEYARAPTVIQFDGTVSDVPHSIVTEILQHKRLDNDKIYGRIMEPILTVNERSAETLNSTNRTYSNFQTPVTKEYTGIGQLTRKESTNVTDRFQFNYNKNLKLNTYITPKDSRIENKDSLVRANDVTNSRDENIHTPVSITHARDFTNGNRLYGNIANMIQPPSDILSHKSDDMKSGRYSGIDNNALYTYQGEHVPYNKDIDYNHAFLYSQNERLNPPKPQNFPCLNISNIGTLSRYSLSDDDRYLSRTFQNAPNESTLESLKLGKNVRVFQNTTTLQNNTTRQKKSSTHTGSVSQYAFDGVPFKDDRQKNTVSVSFALSEESSRKSRNSDDTNITSAYVFSGVGVRPPRKPLLKEPQIGKNTTVVN